MIKMTEIICKNIFSKTPNNAKGKISKDKHANDRGIDNAKLIF